MLQQHSLVSSGIRLFLKLLVLIPLGTLPFVLYYQKTDWHADDDNGCSPHAPVWIGHIEMVLNLTVCFIFFSLFVAHMWQAYHRQNDDLVVSFSSGLYADEEMSNNSKKYIYHAAFRNFLLTFFTSFWITIYYWSLNHVTNNRKAFQLNVFFCRLVLGTELLTNNSILYFLFRNWPFFLLYPCYKSNQGYVKFEGSLISASSTATT